MNYLDIFGICELLWVDETPWIVQPVTLEVTSVGILLIQTEEELWQLLDSLTSIGLLRALSDFIHTYLKEIHLRTWMHRSKKPMAVKTPVFLDLYRNWPRCSFNPRTLFSFVLKLLSSNHAWAHYILWYLWINRWKMLMGFRCFYLHCLNFCLRPEYLWTEDNSRAG